MAERSTESLLDRLAQDLVPVRRIPKLHHAALGVLGAWLAAVAAQALWDGPLPFRIAGIGWGDAAFLVVLGGLGLAATGGLAAALAGAVPGRARAARAGRRIAFAGAMLAVGGGLWALARAEQLAPGLVTGLHCLARACALGIVPAVLLCLFLARAFEPRPVAGAARAGLGAVALGALAVHASCADGGALHVLLGHSLAPFVAATVLALPLSGLVRALSR